MNSHVFQQAVAVQFNHMRQFPLFRADVSGDELWATYLVSFPEGTNPIYRQRTEHDCGCCRHFVRTMGNVVALTDKGYESIWNVELPSSEAGRYGVVAETLKGRVLGANICDLFLHYEAGVGVAKNFEEVLGQVKTWEHFHVTIPSQFIKPKGKIPTLLGERRSQVEVFQRALDTITLESVDIVLELIDQNSLYRGAEFKGLLKAFQKHLTQYRAAGPSARRHYAWHVSARDVGAGFLTVRNSVIGTLLVDLSEGMAVEDAVKSFEAKVAPTNYKRPTALVTKRMIEDAKKTLDGLGLTAALQRRYAVLEDITINNVLFADRSVRAALTGNVFDELAAESVVKPESFSKVEEIPAERFFSEVLPKATGLSVLVENKHVGNLVSLIAPTDPTAPNLFKWDNGFSWSYRGDVADSIKERVKKAGGNVTAELCCRLAWSNSDDLDLHMIEPDNSHIYFGMHRRHSSKNGGMLDVDTNGCDAQNAVDPVENIYYERTATMKPGIYTLKVHCYSKRNNTPDKQGFEVEIEAHGESFTFSYPGRVKSQDMITVAQITMSGDRQISVKGSSDVQATAASKKVWGVTTNTFVPVKAVMLSPNYWDDNAAGNQHWFFMLQDCANEEVARGFYNEFLPNDLLPHRKVLEMIGSKVMTAPSDQQLSGLGFSSTQRASVLCRVTGAFSRVVRVIF